MIDNDQLHKDITYLLEVVDKGHEYIKSLEIRVEQLESHVSELVLIAGI